jgi:photosystem II stability/assembly factor-like uncharacterized protein
MPSILTSSRYARFIALAFLVRGLFCCCADSADLDFNVIPIEPRSRVDAMAYLGNGVVIAGTRGSRPGFVHKSEDYGATWRSVGDITSGEDITCLAAGRNGVGYLLTGTKTHVWMTTSYGESWTDLGRVSNASNRRYANAYGMLVTESGAVLVADADSDGGHIHLSADRGKTWQDLGRISTHALYRLNRVGDGVIANGWAGHIYKSIDDGVTWKDMGKLTDSDLYAIVYLGNNTALIGTKSGHIFRSIDNGATWTDQGVIGASADDFAWLGGSRALYSTYTGNRSMFLCEDSGLTWDRIGGVGTGKSGDWLDHFIGIHDGDNHVVVGGTNKGFILRALIPSE